MKEFNKKKAKKEASFHAERPRKAKVNCQVNFLSAMKGVSNKMKSSTSKSSSQPSETCVSKASSSSYMSSSKSSNASVSKDGTKKTPASAQLTVCTVDNRCICVDIVGLVFCCSLSTLC